MSTDFSERRVQTKETVDKLLAERQTMLVLFCRVAGLSPYQDSEPQRGLLSELCQVLVDYTALLHFELLQRFNLGTERRTEVLDTASRLYPDLTKHAQTAVSFSDKYANPQDAASELDQDLSGLGEMLAERVDLEDELLQVLLGKTDPT